MSVFNIPSTASISPRRRLELALLLSLVLHGVLLVSHFSSQSSSLARHKDRGLEVVLVNARHNQRPDHPQAYAQANLNGGGNTDQPSQATSPLPPRHQATQGDALIDGQGRPQPKTAPYTLLTAPKSKQEVVDHDDEKSAATPNVSLANAQDLMDRALAIARLEAKIEKEMNQYANLPRRKFVGANTQEHNAAQYIEDWRQKVERIGTLNYPDAARGKLYGMLIMTVAIRADGSLERVEINRSSGHPILDQAARRIVNLAAPYPAFPPGLKQTTDILEITRTWNFTNQNQVETR